MSYSIKVKTKSSSEKDKKDLISILSEELDLQESTARLLAKSSPCRVDGISSVVKLDSVINKLEINNFDFEIQSEEGENGEAKEEEFDLEDLEGFVDYYRILGVSPSAFEEDIKNAYRSKSKKYHPDKLENDERLSFYAEMQKTLNEAYDILSDKKERNKYDEKRNRYLSSESEEGQRFQRADEEYYIALGYVDNGQIEKAIDSLQKCIYLDDGHVDAKILLANLYLEEEKFSDARDLAYGLKETEKYRVHALVLLAQCDIFDPESGKINDAVSYCDRAISESPSFILAYQVKAFALEAGNRPFDAADFLEQTLEKLNRQPEIQLALARVYLNVHEVGLATRHVKDVVERGQVPPEVASDISSDFRRARKTVLRQINRSPNNNSQSSGLNMGCWFWAAVIGGTVAPPHFWGVLLLAVGLISKFASSRSKKKRSEFREKKGIQDPKNVIDQSMCKRCEHFNSKRKYCNKVKATVKPEKFLNKDMKCDGKYYYSKVGMPEEDITINGSNVEADVEHKIKDGVCVKCGCSEGAIQKFGWKCKGER